jgi:HTH-type transcriptional regulator/antitoxin HigA
MTHTLTLPILSETDLRAALEEVEKLWGAPTGSPEGDRLDELVTRIEVYETLDELITRPHWNEKA